LSTDTVAKTASEAVDDLVSDPVTQLYVR